MCLIVDANAAGRFLCQRSPVTDWLLGLRGNPRLVAAGKLRVELSKIETVRRLLLALERAGRLRFVTLQSLHDEETRLRKRDVCRSNDIHVIALGITSGARTLSTFDAELARDFTNPNIINSPRGKIYQNPETHAHLLGHTKGCGVTSQRKKRKNR